MASKDEKILKKMEKRQAKFVKKQSRSKARIIAGKIFVGLFIAFLCVVLACVIKYGSMMIEYKEEAVKMVDKAGVSAFKQGETSILYADDGTEINSLVGEKDMYYMNIGEIPFLVKRALISTEDRSFYEHEGIDYSAIVRASYEYVKNKGYITQGGSTITQQLSKLIFLSTEQTFKRKIKEMFVAMEIENRYTKDQILEFYINNIYFANGFYGIQAAAQGYFSKDAANLSLSEIAFLCSIPNNPTKYDPYTNFENTMKRRDRILKEMYEQGDIDENMYNEAINATVILFPTENSKNNYVETYAKYCATIELMKQNGFVFRNEFSSPEDENAYDEQYDELYDSCSSMLYSGGYRIYTSIDLNKQAQLQSSVDLRFEDYMDVDDNGTFKLQSAATCIDNSTGYVVAIVGGRTQDATGYTLNRAYQSYRQPGSTIKPILVYTPAFEKGYTPDKYLEDKKIEDGPVNSPNTYDGWISIRRAVEKSKNTIAWNLFEELTPEFALGYLKRMEFKRIVADDYVLPASIGGLTYGVTTVEMASAYATLENQGVFHSPSCIKRITDSSGNPIIENNITPVRIYEANAANSMTDVLRGVLTNGTGKGFGVDDVDLAAKTGTTNDNKDVWLCGYSAYYTTAVWVGYDLPREITDNYILKSAGGIWSDYMEKVHAGLSEVSLTTHESYDSDDDWDDDWSDDSDYSDDSDDLDNQDDSENQDGNYSDEGGSEEESEQENVEESQEDNTDKKKKEDKDKDKDKKDKDKDKKEDNKEESKEEKEESKEENDDQPQEDNNDDGGNGGQEEQGGEEQGGNEVYQENWGDGE